MRWYFTSFLYIKLILSHLGLHHFGSRPRRHGIVSGNSREQNFPVGHPSWECSGPFSLNFRVPTEPEASELPKGLVLGRDENIHIRFTGSTPLGDVGSYNPPPLGPDVLIGTLAPHDKVALISNCHIPARAPTTSRARLRRSTILFTLGPDHALTVLFLGTHASRTS